MSGRTKAILESDSESESELPLRVQNDESDQDQNDSIQQEAVDPESPDPEPEFEAMKEAMRKAASSDEENEEEDEQSTEKAETSQQPQDSSGDESEPLKSRNDTQDDEVDNESSDSDDSSVEKEKLKKKKKKRRVIMSDDEDAGSNEGEDDKDDDDDDDDDDDEDNQDGKDDDGEDEGNAKKAGPEEDDEEEEGREEEEDDDDDASSRRQSSQNNTIYDFDIMMAKKKEENSRKRKRRNYDIINDNDDIIADIINQMKDAVEADSESNKNKMAATRKLKLLPFVISQLRKVDLRDAFLDSDVLSVITEWLAPLPDRSLPHLNIRENLLKILIDFNLYDVDRIKGSGIGKAVMYLYKHPKETRENKQRAKQLISCWSRPIFQLDSSFNSISREEREQRDLELMSKQRRASQQNGSPDGERAGPSSSSKKAKEETALKPGQQGWIPRARVPAPSMRDYVIRPRSKVDGDVGKSSKRPSNMLEKYMKNQQERRRANRQQRAINMKIDRV